MRRANELRASCGDGMKGPGKSDFSHRGLSETERGDGVILLYEEGKRYQHVEEGGVRRTAAVLVIGHAPKTMTWAGSTRTSFCDCAAFQ